MNVWFEGPSKVTIRTEKIPEPIGDEYLVKAKLSTISCGSERTLLKGNLNRTLSLDPVFASHQTLEFPFPYGYQMVGHVVAQGKNVPQNLLHKRVFCFAPHSNYAVVKAPTLFPLSDMVDDIQATLLANMETALTLVWDLHPFMREKIAVFGQGIVGILTSLLLSRIDLSDLFVFDLNPKKRALAEKLGFATVFAEPENEDLVDGAIEVSGNAKALESCIRVTQAQGRIVLGSWYADDDKPQLGTTFHRKRQQLLASQVSSVNSRLGSLLSKERRIQEALKLIECIPLEYFDTKVFSINDAVQAYNALMAGEQDLIVFSYS